MLARIPRSMACVFAVCLVLTGCAHAPGPVAEERRPVEDPHIRHQTFCANYELLCVLGGIAIGGAIIAVMADGDHGS